jgi:nitric oxide reductase subunit B
MSDLALSSVRPLPRQDRATKILIIVLVGVTIAAWSAMALMTVLTYRGAPPLPANLVSADGETIMTRADIVAGKAGFQKADLMDYGSLYGMGSYFGEDYTASVLVAIATGTEGALTARPLAELSESERKAVRARMQSLLQGIALTAGDVEVPPAVTTAIRQTRQALAARLLRNDDDAGYSKAHSLSAAEAGQVADFLIYSAITTVARIPGLDYSWTSNWPPEPSVGNTPPAGALTWTVVSLGGLILGIGIVLAIFRVYIDREDASDQLHDILGDFWELTPSQEALAKFFVLVSLVLLLQILAGAILGHYYAERASFYGVRISDWLPFNFVRAIHVQAPIIWIGLGWIASALFLAPRIGQSEPRGQVWLVNVFFAIVCLIAVGAFAGDYAGVMNWTGRAWFWIGNQGLEYLELGRLWQILFFVGLLGWSGIMLRAMWPTLLRLLDVRDVFSAFRAEHLLWYSSLGIAVIYAFGMIPLTGIEPSFTITDFWRWWVVHLWVEWSFELFSAAVTGYFLMAIGLVSRQLAERAILFEWILILGSGILGTGHHMFWAGEPAIWLSVGGVFSFLEVLPLFLLVLEGISHRQQIGNQHDFPYRLAFTFIIGSIFWNFIGAGVFGGIVNAPIVNYYEHATFLTLNHAHTSMFGAFGLLSIGLIYLALRYMAGDRFAWSDRLGLWAFWLYNIGLIMWVFMNFLPVGIPQLEAVYKHGFAYARSLDFYDQMTFWQWLRTPGDIIFAAGALLMAADFILKLRRYFAASS